ncbi:hypothetical protein EDC96DRAFT_29886 [Choanephora cucurbitarum]|nr:hypothetical protein EDC96DRAFT_29886 [Choanephora cucurbitarum]
MWFLYKIDKDDRFNSILYMRLRPNTRNPLVKSQQKAYILVGNMSSGDAEAASFKPDIQLESNHLEARVDLSLVSEQLTYLHDQQIIHLIDSDIQFKICWEPLGIYHIRSNDYLVHQQLVEAASTYGFHVLGTMDRHKITHYYLDKQILTHKDQPPHSLLTALVNLLPCITSTWLEGLEAQDDHYDRNRHDQTIEIVQIEQYGPLKKTAFLGKDKRRQHLFKGLEFWFFDQQQYDKYSPLVKKAGGKTQLVTLEEGLTGDIPRDALFVDHPYLANAGMEETWRTIQKRFQDEMKCERCVLEWEIEYSIMYCSTNMMCNPCSDLWRYIPYQDPLYRSLESSSATVKIKQEPLDESPFKQTVPCSGRSSIVFLDDVSQDELRSNRIAARHDIMDTVFMDHTVRAAETVPLNHTTSRRIETVPVDQTARMVETFLLIELSVW